jgi:hypothetical protein
MSYNSDLDRVKKRSLEQGWRIKITTAGHHQFIPPDKDEEIVVTSGTPGDQRSWNNFLSDMRRSGYRDEPLTAMGEAFEAARGASPVPVSKPPTTHFVLEVLGRHLDGMSVANIQAYVLSQRPDLTEYAVPGALASLKAKGKVMSVGHGFYRIASPVKEPRVIVHVPEPVPPVVEFKPPVLEPTTTAPVMIAGSTTGDPAIDVDLAELDAALVALSKIEAVVRRNRAVLAQFAVLKQLLNKVPGTDG